MERDVPHNAGNRATQDPATPFSGLQRKDPLLYLRDTCLCMFTAALFTSQEMETV